MTPVVSVIIPFYSHKEWLQEALDSVFNQTFLEFEVILVDDGSKEDVNDLLFLYKGRVNYYKQMNQGPGAARNLGISKAKGKYIAFEDSDDIWEPTKLEKQVAFMESRGLLWSHTGFKYWWPEQNKEKVVNVSREYGNIYLQRHISVKMATPCVIINREFLLTHKLSFPEQLRNGEDGALWMELSKLAPVGLVQEPLAKIRIRGGNSYTHAIERFRLNSDFYETLKKSKENLPKGILWIKYIYYTYAKMLPGKITPIKEFIAKCLWLLPYTIERVYIRKLVHMSNKDERFIIRY